MFFTHQGAQHSTAMHHAASDSSDTTICWQTLLQECAAEEHDFFTKLQAETSASNVLEKIFSCSPYLTRLCWQYPVFLRNILEEGITKTAESWRVSPLASPSIEEDKTLMALLRRHKSQGALLIAIADITETWDLSTVTRELTLLAERTLQASLDHLWRKLEAAGHIRPTPQPCEGLIVLGMGKMGGYELNYSSDIDLVMLYDAEKIEYTGRQSLQHCLNRFSQDLVRLMQERTAEGYVFRVDLRLRPDPASTPTVVALRAAMNYYETVGQNWERAAFIKARPVGGDIQAGNEFLQELRPFLWRRHLDFAAIADIQSIKRQMDHREMADFSLAGHNVKRGLGGIREIEFIAQINQLIWGGRLPALRIRGTCDTLRTLAKLKLIDKKTVETLVGHYECLRVIEHRIQMMEDQQTHTIPESEHERTTLAYFCNFQTLADFEAFLEPRLREVHDIYRNSFNTEPPLAADGNLSFTGVDLDESTLQTITNLGFQDAERVVTTIANWHRGNVRAMRNARARELLTELTPALLKAFSETADPDSAFQHFSKFLERLPAVVQLFSLFISNPQLLETVAVIMGNAPGLANHLSRHPEWLDILLTTRLQDTLGEKPEPNAELLQNGHEEEWVEWLCRYRNEREFLIGTEILKGRLDPLDGYQYLTSNADAVLECYIPTQRARFEKSYGKIRDSGMAILGLGRFGSRELCFGSDLDLVFLYDAKDDQALSDGEKPYSAMVYYNRLCQRLVGGLEAATGEGRLYDVDTRLRPGGKDSPMAMSVDGFLKYFRDSAWTFEKMALLRHRILYADDALAARLPAAIASLYHTENNLQKIAQDAAEMRERIAKEYQSNNPWRVKHARGGLLDMTFIAQVLALQYGNKYPDLIRADILEIITLAAQHRLMTEADQQALAAAWQFQSRLANLLRLCQREFSEETAPKGLLTLLANRFSAPDYASVREALIQHQQAVHEIYQRYIHA